MKSRTRSPRTSLRVSSLLRDGHALRLCAGIVAFGGMAACGSGADEPGQSAGLAQWPVDSVPVFDVASMAPDGSPAFFFAGGATRLADGRVAVVDPFDAAVRLFDASGKPIRKVGRRGDGPGEFQAPAWIQQCGADSLFVWDFMRASITVMDSAGRVAREYPERGNTYALSCSRTGVVAGLGGPAITGPPNAKGETYEAPLWLADTHGVITKPFGDVAFGENRPLGRLTRVAAASDRVFVGTADSAYVDVYALDGRRMGAVPVGVELRRPTERNYERAIDGMVALMTSREMREGSKKQMLKIPMPEHLPAYTGVFADPAGTLWVLTSAPGDPDTRLRALTEDGRVLGEVRVPRELRVFEVGMDYVLGSYDDAQGEQHVAMYRMHRNP